MLITHEELQSRFKGSDFIVGKSTISHICTNTYTILTYYEKGKTYIITIGDEHDYIRKLIDNSFLGHFEYTQLMSWYIPETKYYGRVFKMYELQRWR